MTNFDAKKIPKRISGFHLSTDIWVQALILQLSAVT